MTRPSGTALTQPGVRKVFFSERQTGTFQTVSFQGVTPLDPTLSSPVGSRNSRNPFNAQEIIILKSWRSETIRLGKIEIEGKNRAAQAAFLFFPESRRNPGDLFLTSLRWLSPLK